MPTLFVVVPYFNEPSTLAACIGRLGHAALPRGWSRTIVLVDDASAPAGRSAADAIAASGRPGLELLRHPVNAGKGAALMTGFDWVLSRASDDDAVLVHDADLEYDPADHAALVAALTADPLVAVYGDRWHGAAIRPGMVAWLHRTGNRTLTALSNALTGLRVHDMECCSKLLRVPLLRAVRPRLSEPRFGIEPQMTAAIARVGGGVREVPVRYEARGFSDGKKIGMRDGLRALWVILRERLR
ncbi:MAG: Undecaprenyl-phosphate 4-deoxy-4-formamido-L-arabinose transferase [Planctomycetota bacterium]|jgi:glycosyltransferase involved in cell wall biosynthesis